MAASSSAAAQESYMDALGKETLVKLIIGPEPHTTFLVPRSQVVQCWGGQFAAQLRAIERQPSVETIKASALPTSSKGRKKVLKALSPLKKKDDQPNPLGIELPNDDSRSWAAFLFWSADPKSSLPQEVRARDYRLVRCYNLGMKYRFFEFADAVMLCLLSGFEQHERREEEGPSFSNQAFREAYCFGDRDLSTLPVLLCEEFVKYGCRLVGPDHDSKECRGCATDKANRRALSKCCLGEHENNPHGKDKTCPLKDHLVDDIYYAKKQLLRNRDKFFNRMTKFCDGKAGGNPVYMDYLVSDDWKEISDAFPKFAPKEEEEVASVPSKETEEEEAVTSGPSKKTEEEAVISGPSKKKA